MKISFLTLGCKVNFYETEKIMEQFRSKGFEIVSPEQPSDCYLINTCTVTNMAGRKSRKMIHRGKRHNPDCLVVAMGCYVDSDRETLERDSDIDLIISNEEKPQAVEKIVSLLQTRASVQSVGCESESQLTEYHVAHERTRAFIKVQDGCNQFCSYCIIPYVRGRLKSRACDEVVEEIQTLAKRNYHEVVITGIHLSSYGVDLTGEKNFLVSKGRHLLELLEQISQIDGIERIRLGSLEPRIITDEFLSGLVTIKKVCPHFHLSLQSGCDTVLKRMNRKYTCDEYEETCRLLRSYYTNPAITTDVIVGFPGETEQEFLETVEYVKQIQLSDIHIFRYSVRKGTRAETMENQVPEPIKVQRSNVLNLVKDELKQKYCSCFIGKEEMVLFEEEVKMDDTEYLVGHNERYVKVAVPIQEALSKKYQKNGLYQVHVEKVLKN